MIDLRKTENQKDTLMCVYFELRDVMNVPLLPEEEEEEKYFLYQLKLDEKIMKYAEFRQTLKEQYLQHGLEVEIPPKTEGVFMIEPGIGVIQFWQGSVPLLKTIQTRMFDHLIKQWAVAEQYTSLKRMAGSLVYWLVWVEPKTPTP